VLVDDPVTILPAEIAASGPGRRLARVRTEVFTPLKRKHPQATFMFRLGRLRAATYYDGLSLDIRTRPVDGEQLSIADGGSTDWTQRLLSDGKERLLVSGIATELIARLL